MKLNNPIHVSIAIYQLAKLRMLQFYYDCIDRYFDRSDFQYQEMDTDSAYIAFSADKPFETLIKPELKEHFEQHSMIGFRVITTKKSLSMTDERLVYSKKNGVGKPFSFCRQRTISVHLEPLQHEEC